MTSKMPFESSATATTATNSATYLMNSRLLACPDGPAFASTAAAAGDAAIAWPSERASDRASDRPWGVSGCREMVIGHLLARRAELVSCRNAVGVAVGSPPHRTVRAAFPHTAPTLDV